MNVGVGIALGIAVGVAAASGVVCAQAAPSSDPEQQLLEQIAELRSRSGPNPEGLIDPLRALALVYEEGEDHAFAIRTLEDARHVTRVHRGLSSVDEALLLRQQIRNEKALGNHARVWNLEQDMVTIARKHHDDIRTAPIFRDLAEDRAEALEQYTSGDAFPPEIYLGCYYARGPRRYDDTRGAQASAPGGSCRSGTRDQVIGQLRAEVLIYYADAIRVFIEHGDYASQELRDLEREALGFGSIYARTACARTSLNDLLRLPLIGTCLEPARRVGAFAVANVGGWAGLVRLISYELRSDAPLAARAHAFAELADWQFAVIPPTRRHLEDATEMALALYEQIYEQVREGGDSSLVTEIFSPELPVTLPAYRPNPFAAAAAAESPRYIDVAFAITRYGRAERIEILDTGEGVTRAERRDLARLIESTSFRPRVSDGALAASAPVTLRYHLGP